MKYVQVIKKFSLFLSSPSCTTPKVSPWQRNLRASWWHLQRRGLTFPLVSSDTHTTVCPSGSLYDTVCTYHWVWEVYTHVHTHVQAQRGSGQTGGERGSQWPVCSPLWWALHEPGPPSISHSPVVKATHRPLYCLISPSHLRNTHTFTNTYTDSSWSVDFSVCFGLFIYVCNFVCVCVRRVCGCAWTCGHVSNYTEVSLQHALCHPV